MTPDPNRDRVQREILIQAPVERVFSALIDPAFYPSWGPQGIDGAVAPGEKPVLDFGEKGGGKARVHVVAVDPPGYWAFRWAQGSMDPEVLLGDPLAVPNTLVEFHVEATAEGTRVRVTESGFQSLPDPSRFEALEGPAAGWGLMLKGLARSLQPQVPVGDRMENDLMLTVPPERVYGALVDPVGWWAQGIEGENVPGETPTWDFGPFGQWRVHIVAAEPTRYFAYRRDPLDPSQVPAEATSTLVEFHLMPTPIGTLVQHSESGFEALPEESREGAFRGSEQIWPIILGLLEGHLAKG